MSGSRIDRRRRAAQSVLRAHYRPLIAKGEAAGAPSSPAPASWSNVRSEAQATKNSEAVELPTIARSRPPESKPGRRDDGFGSSDGIALYRHPRHRARPRPCLEPAGMHRPMTQTAGGSYVRLKLRSAGPSVPESPPQTIGKIDSAPGFCGGFGPRRDRGALADLRPRPRPCGGSSRPESPSQTIVKIDSSPGFCGGFGPGSDRGALADLRPRPRPRGESSHSESPSQAIESIDSAPGFRGGFGPNRDRGAVADLRPRPRPCRESSRPESPSQTIEKIDSAPGFCGGFGANRGRGALAVLRPRPRPCRGSSRPEIRSQTIEKIDSAPGTVSPRPAARLVARAGKRRAFSPLRRSAAAASSPQVRAPRSPKATGPRSTVPALSRPGAAGACR